MRRRRAFPIVLSIALATAAGVALACTHPLRDTIEGARLYGAGTRALDRGDATTAIDRLEHAARLVPHASEIRHHLGLAYRAAGEPERARTALETAVALDCENDAAQASLARLIAETRGAAAPPGRTGPATPGDGHAETRGGGRTDGG